LNLFGKLVFVQLLAMFLTQNMIKVCFKIALADCAEDVALGRPWEGQLWLSGYMLNFS